MHWFCTVYEPDARLAYDHVESILLELRRNRAGGHSRANRSRAPDRHRADRCRATDAATARAPQLSTARHFSRNDGSTLMTGHSSRASHCCSAASSTPTSGTRRRRQLRRSRRSIRAFSASQKVGERSGHAEPTTLRDVPKAATSCSTGACRTVLGESDEVHEDPVHESRRVAQGREPRARFGSQSRRNGL